MVEASKILIVEDNEKNMKLMRDLLQFHGYTTVEADNAEDGIKLAIADIPDLILLDIQLPGMSGIEALKVLRQDSKTASIPVIAVTASVMTHDRKKLLEVGFDDYQPKPLEIKSFIERIARMLTKG